MSIRTRLAKIQEAAKGVALLATNRNQHHRHYGLRSVTDPAVNYQVTVRWSKGQLNDVEYLIATCECQRVGAPDMIDCQGNGKTVCYHCLAALMFGAESKDKNLVLFDGFYDALTYSNFGGQLIQVRSDQSNGIGWAVLKDKNDNGRVLSDGTYQTDRERQQADLEEYHRVAGE